MKKHPFVAEMKGFDWLAHSVLTRLFNYRDISKKEKEGESLYLRRFYLWRKRNFKVFLHNIRRSDSDRHLHDHPWDFVTVCLKGGYVEMCGVPDGVVRGKRWFSRGDILRNPAEHIHAVKLFHDFFKIPNTGTTWTLVFTGPAKRTWGFWVDRKWVDWRTYLGLPPETPDCFEDQV